MSGHPKLANHEHVQGSAKRPRDFERDWDAASRKSQHYQVLSAGEVLELTGEDCPSVSSIGKP